MNISRKTLATIGFLGLTVVAVPAITPAVAAADTPSMYDSCSAQQLGQIVTSPAGNTLECVGTDTGSGYDWEAPADS